MRIFVAGATGVIGRRVVPMLVAGGHDVTAMTHSPQKTGSVAGSGATPAQADLFDPASLRRAIAGHDAIVNLATHLPQGFKMFLPGAWAENDRIRREGAANLVDAALAEGVPRFVQESFAPVYPDRGAQWIDESVPIAPVRYNRTVADAEAAAARFAARSGIATTLRFGAFYGPDAWQTRDMIGYVRRGFAPMPGPAEAYVSSISHDDAAAAVVAALDAPGGVYNVVDDEPVTHRGYFSTLAALLGVSAPRLPPRWLTFLFGSPGELLARSQRISNRKLREISNWAPKYRSIREGWPAVLAAGTA
jgi:nucleoside-diphosphate-sugar epimerase